MVTIDVLPVTSDRETQEFQVEREALPSTWGEAAQRLGVDPKTLSKRRKALGGMDIPLTQEFYNELRLISRWCAMRNNGGGASCTEHEYVRLKSEDPDYLEKRLKELKIQ